MDEFGAAPFGRTELACTRPPLRWRMPLAPAFSPSSKGPLLSTWPPLTVSVPEAPVEPTIRLLLPALTTVPPLTVSDPEAELSPRPTTSQLFDTASVPL